MLPGHFFLLRKLPGFELHEPEIGNKQEVEQFLSVFIQNNKKACHATNDRLSYLWLSWEFEKDFLLWAEIGV